ncbi:hypothetical protein RN607_01510 [Demequina capsici]|uniref:Uncharacterized protein n=1 Tax=Demequina capsici TaxID=3075620 RepID=A0AA96FDQ6_9MICO|nr:hypothetical protein [Demequina sp. PMTSA13]WNM27709.1 hypothetical protein RN607_01510 [Demequina sp. PMTSA13]
MRNTHRTLAAVAAASVGVLVIAGCSTATGERPSDPVSSSVDQPANATATTTSSVYTFADGASSAPAADGDHDGDPRPQLADATTLEAVAVWDLDLTFAAANALNGTEPTLEPVGDTDAMPDDAATSASSWMVAA